MDPIGKTFTLLESVDSTNNYAMAQVHAGMAKHGDVYFSLEQTAGKGQRGKGWNSGIGENILLSCVLQPLTVSVENQFILSITIAIACYEFVNHYTKSETTLKWPNDIYWRDRKAGGILIENKIKGSLWQYAVVGIGLNINQILFPENLPNPVSLKQITKKTYDILQLARELCNYIQNRWELLARQSHQETLEDYNNILYKKGEEVTLKYHNRLFKTIIRGVDINGRLITFNAKEGIFNWGEVEWVS